MKGEGMINMKKCERGRVTVETRRSEMQPDTCKRTPSIYGEKYGSIRLPTLTPL